MTSTPMQCLIDWYSFTVPLVGVPDSGEIPVLKVILDVLRQFGLGVYLETLWTGDLELFNSKGFYAFRAMDRTTKLSLSFGGVNNHVLIDCTGETCQHLRDSGQLYSLVALTGKRASRIDITADIVTDVRPGSFVDLASNTSIKSHSSIVSDTGATSYLGSWNSDRFARVYRYDGDHPRAHLLRVEHVHRGKWAKAVAELSIDMSCEKLLISCADNYGWTHPCWTPENVAVSKIRAAKHDRDGAATLKWLNNAVAPALLKSHREGLINAKDWFDQAVMKLINSSLSWREARDKKSDAVPVRSEMLDMNPIDGFDLCAVTEPQIDVDHPEPGRA